MLRFYYYFITHFEIRIYLVKTAEILSFSMNSYFPINNIAYFLSFCKEIMYRFELILLVSNPLNTNFKRIYWYIFGIYLYYGILYIIMYLKPSFQSIIFISTLQFIPILYLWYFFLLYSCSRVKIPTISKSHYRKVIICEHFFMA